MSVSRDQIVIVDVESTCWKGTAPPGQQSEIVEIGICLFDLSACASSDKRSILVKPERSKVSAFCTRLTTLTQAQVNQGIRFVEACAVLEDEYLTRARAWASWGNYDCTMFERQCESFYVRYPFSEMHINLKQLFAFLHKQKQVGMARALDMSELALEGTHHRGGDDAWNVARLLQAMLRRFGNECLAGFWNVS